MTLPQCITTKLTAGILAAVTMASPVFAVSGTVEADGGLRLRSGAGTNNTIVTTIPNGAEVDVSAISADGAWLQVSYQDTMGYVAGEFVLMDEAEAEELDVLAEPVYGYTTEGPLNVRSAPNTGADRVKQIPSGTVVEILDELIGWYEIDSGFVSADYVKIIDAEEAANYGGGAQVVALAQQYLGYPYVYGGTSPSGFDCSGFVKYIFAQLGVTVNRTASAQLDNGMPVAMSELQPGDAVFFKKAGTGSSRASHVGIYIGNGQFIHASTSTTGVIISDLDYAYYTTGFVGGRRMI